MDTLDSSVRWGVLWQASVGVGIEEERRRGATEKKTMARGAYRSAKKIGSRYGVQHFF
jgi:hypothetical protein